MKAGLKAVFFNNEEQDLMLTGLLFEPEGEDLFPAAVIIHGSGTSNNPSSPILF